MKALARSYCWWPRLDDDIEGLTKNCLQCQMTRTNPKKVKTHVWEAAKKPFERVHVDFAGPFMGTYFFLLIDAYSKWPEVYVIPNITTTTTIEICREIFSRFGIPEILVSDNGTQFTGDEFQNFLKMNGIYHKKSAPYHPATNGQAERNVQTIKNKLKTINCDRSDIKKELCKILLNYRRTPHATTGESPAFLMLNREVRTRLDIMVPKERIEQVSSEVVTTNLRKIEINARVSVRNYTGNDKYQFGTVIEVLGSLHYLVKLDDGRIWKRHINQIHEIGSNISQTRFDPIPYHYDISANSDINPGENTIIPNTTDNNHAMSTLPPEEVIHSSTTTEELPQIVTETMSIPEQRKTKRQAKPKKLLTYDENFKQT